MSCLIKIKEKNYILIGGGLDDNEKALKSW